MLSNQSDIHRLEHTIHVNPLVKDILVKLPEDSRFELIENFDNSTISVRRICNIIEIRISRDSNKHGSYPIFNLWAVLRIEDLQDILDYQRELDNRDANMTDQERERLATERAQWEHNRDIAILEKRSRRQILDK